MQIVLTARTYVLGAYLNWLPRLELSEFTDDQVKVLVNKWLGDRPEEIERFFKELRAAVMLTELMRVPLLATLILLVFRQTHRLPESKPRLYEIFTDLMCEGWNLAKGVLRTSQFGQRIKKAVLSSLAVACHERGLRAFETQLIRESIAVCVSRAVCSNWQDLKNELLHDGLISQSGVQFQFAHLSFQEFLAARAMLGEPNRVRLREALQGYLRGQDWWLETLRFYIGLAGAPLETYNWVVEESGLVSKDAKGEVELTAIEDRAEELLQSIRQMFPEAPMKI
jgi:predicted NACHT family NTPase